MCMFVFLRAIPTHASCCSEVNHLSAFVMQKDPSGDASEEEEDAPDAVPHSKEVRSPAAPLFLLL